MLIVISDLHFTDGTVGEHLSSTTFERILLGDIATLARAKKSRAIKVLLLGDVVDLIRSEYWQTVPSAERPWGASGLKDVPKPRQGSPTERHCLAILGTATDAELAQEVAPETLGRTTILAQNWRTFCLFRTLAESLQRGQGVDAAVEIIYIPGNHDRLCNLYPLLRQEVRRLLGITVSADTVDGAPTGAWRFRDSYLDEAHGVFARHGHQYDIWNYDGGEDLSAEGHLRTPVGDVFTAEIVVKIPRVVASLRDRYPSITDDFIKSIKDIDNVRPLHSVMEWFYYRMKRERNEDVSRAFNDAFGRVVQDLFEIDLIRTWNNPGTLFDDALRAMSKPWVRWLPKSVLGMFDADYWMPLFIGIDEMLRPPEQDKYVEAAYKRERVWRENRNIQFILYGHTHIPQHCPLDASQQEVLYLNTGTWRTRIYKTVSFDKEPDFLELQQVTYSVFYRRDEEPGGTRTRSLSFDVWTGFKKDFAAG